MNTKSRIINNVVSGLILAVIIFVPFGSGFALPENMEWTVSTIHNGNEASGDILADVGGRYPREGIAVNSKGEVFVADPKNNVIRKINSRGNETIVLGNKEQKYINVEDESAAVGFEPSFIAIDSKDNLYVLNKKDSYIYKVDKQYKVRRFFDLSGDRLAGLAVDKEGNLWITLSGYHFVGRISPEGYETFLMGSVKEKGFVDGNGTKVRFNYPGDIAVGPDNALYIVDEGNSAIRKMDLSTYEVTTVAVIKKETDSDGNPIMQAYQENLLSITVAPNGVIYFGQLDGTIGEIKNGVVTTILGQQDVLGHLDGIGLQTKFNVPRYITAKDNNTLYITDLFNGVVRKAVYGPATVTGITLQEKEVELTVGDTYTLVPIVTSPNAVNKKVTYGLSNYGVANVDVNGKITAVKPGVVMIGVTTVEGGFTDTVTVNVSPPASDTALNPIRPTLQNTNGSPYIGTLSKTPIDVAVTGIQIQNKPNQLSIGDLFKLNVTVGPENATNKFVSYRTSDQDIATVDFRGNITAVGPGTVTIRATTEEGSFTDSTTFNVSIKNDLTVNPIPTQLPSEDQNFRNPITPEPIENSIPTKEITIDQSKDITPNNPMESIILNENDPKIGEKKDSSFIDSTTFSRLTKSDSTISPIPTAFPNGNQTFSSPITPEPVKNSTSSVGRPIDHNAEIFPNNPPKSLIPKESKSSLDEKKDRNFLQDKNSDERQTNNFSQEINPQNTENVYTERQSLDKSKHSNISEVKLPNTAEAFSVFPLVGISLATAAMVVVLRIQMKIRKNNE